ncbi:tetratricopeptide repeat protein [Chryseobacterium sp. OV279]|uniref:tetratricopeptide repeat protein n=1 Tax=Chryseobacterium sp. OV279 TaxID=1500285 RepID=UPI00091444D0|nr:tetratricopeptide repeat protein [Chryseobacterium sp. OV279]SHG23777.1 Tetratricopeptide repeat-containing protein [Chryseobacterium sp. OV279]
MKNNILRGLVPMMTLVFFLTFVLSCSTSREDDYDYFQKLAEWGGARLDKPGEIRARVAEELKKYNETGDKKFLISSRYTESFVDLKNTGKSSDVLGLYQLPIVYDLLKLSNGQYRFVTASCNFNLAVKFEKNSPKLAMQFLDKAIAAEEQSGGRYFLPHLYHFKGRLYYNAKDYKNAIIYFGKALKIHDAKKDQLYIASMHNNFAMCYDKMNQMDKAVQELETAVKILENIPKPKLEVVYFLAKVKVDKGYYQYKLKEYAEAEQTLLTQLEFYRNHPEQQYETIVCLRYLFNIYKDRNQLDKIQGVLDIINTIEPKLKDIANQIEVDEIIQSYYAYVGNDTKVKELSFRLMSLHEKQDEASEKNFSRVSNALNDYIIKNINQRYEHTLEDQKLRNTFMFVLILLLVIVFFFIFVTIRNKYRKDKELAVKEKVILQKTKTILENNIKLQEDKISSLHLNLNLKIETEKEFLEHIKKVKRSKNADAEKTISDLFFKINNLIQIDKKNYDLINESSLENRQFVDKLSARFPMLTQQDLKYCVYFKLDLSSKEISLLENITEGSARVYKTKIKTKMDLGKETDLNSFLKTI